MPDYKRRTFLTDAGEPLLGSPSPVLSIMRLDLWQKATGLSFDDLIVTPLNSMPLPAYAASYDGPRRWSRVHPSVLWHPLFWLPDRMASRYQLTDEEDGSTETESHRLWSVRIGLELTASGLYDQISGTWLDVLDIYGIDSDDPDDQERIRRWLAGGPDDILDSVDLAPIIDDTEDPDWAIEIAQADMEGIAIIAWAMMSDAMLDFVADLEVRHESGDVDLEEALDVSAMITEMVQANTHDFPDDEDPSGHSEAEAQFWADLGAQLALAESVDEIMDEGVPVIIDRLEAIHQAFWPMANALAAREQELAAAAG